MHINVSFGVFQSTHAIEIYRRPRQAFSLVLKYFSFSLVKLSGKIRWIAAHLETADRKPLFPRNTRHLKDAWSGVYVPSSRARIYDGHKPQLWEDKWWLCTQSIETHINARPLPHFFTSQVEGESNCKRQIEDWLVDKVIMNIKSTIATHSNDSILWERRGVIIERFWWRYFEEQCTTSLFCKTHAQHIFAVLQRQWTLEEFVNWAIKYGSSRTCMGWFQSSNNSALGRFVSFVSFIVFW